MANRRSTTWSDAELALFDVLRERGLVNDSWPNRRLFRLCRVCCVEFVPTRDGPRGPFPIECSDSCRRVFAAWNADRWRAGDHRLPSECIWCFGPFVQSRGGSGNRSRYCSRQCFQMASNHLTSNAELDRCEIPRCPDCDRITNRTKRQRSDRLTSRRPRGRCSDCQRRAERIQSLQYPIGPVRDRQRRRNRVIAAGDRISPAEVLERFGTICYLCHGEIDPMIDDLRHPMHLEIDHIIPISRGGQHRWDNVAPTHRECNLRKGAKLVAPPVGWKGTWTP